MLKNSLIVVLSVVFWIVIFEAGSNLWIKTWGNPYQKSLNLLEADVALGWRQKPKLNVRFFDSHVTTNSLGFRSSIETMSLANSDSLILTLGPSSAFGWGVDESNTYTEVLKEKLNADGDRKYEALNLSQIGHSTYQGYLLARSPNVQQIEPKIVLLAYGVNDTDRFRFFFQSPKSDFEEFATERTSNNVSVLNFINSSAFLRLTSIFTSKTLLNFSCQNLRELPARRLSEDQTINYYSELIKKYRKSGARIVVLTTPHHFEGLDPAFSQSYEELFSSSRTAATQGDCRAAKELLEESRKLEKNIIARDIIGLNKRLRELAKQEDVALADAELLLTADRYFLDPIHPTKEGHQVIAENIFELLKMRDNEQQK